MTFQCSFNAIPMSILSGGSVRFLPYVSGNLYPIASYSWVFGDGNTSTSPTPTNTYPTVTSQTSYTVGLTVTDTQGNPASFSISQCITVDIAANVPAPANNGVYQRVSIFIYDINNGMMVNRTATDICSLYLQTPVIQNLIDQSPQSCTFSLVDVGNSTDIEKSLIAQGKFVIVIQGRTIVFSGIIRRATHGDQAMSTSTNQMVTWDIECDSDLLKLQNINVLSSVLAANPQTVSLSPGALAQLILTPASGAWDWRGNINTIDTAVSFQMYPATPTDQIPSQYDLITSLQGATNYDMITRYEYELRQYTAAEVYNNELVIEIDNANFTPGALVGMYCFVVSDYFIPLNYGFSATFDTVNSIVDVANNTFSNDTQVTFSGSLPTGITQGVAYYVINATPTGFQISLTLAGSAVTLSGSSGITGTVLIAQPQRGVRSWGKITSNTSTNIVSTATVNLQYPQEFGGYVIIAHGPKFDFAIDLSTPSPVASLTVNADVFDYSDNDDTRKFYSQVVVKGNDLFGKSISVSLSAIHAWNIQRQYFNDCTFVRLKSEGYIYKNNYFVSSASQSATCYYANGGVSFTTTYAINHYAIQPLSVTSFPVNMPVYFIAGNGGIPLPINIVAGQRYFVVYNNLVNIYISSTIGGSAIDIGSDATGSPPLIYTKGTLMVNNSPAVFTAGLAIGINASVMPHGLTAGTVYYCGNPGTAASPYFLELFSDSGLTTQVSFGYTNAGSGIVVYLDAKYYNTELGSPPIVWLYGHGFTIPSGSTMSLMNFSGSYTIVTTAGAASEGTDSNGNAYTAVPISWYPTSDFSGNGFFLAQRIYVGQASVVGANPVIIGEEPVTINAIGTDTTYGDYIDFGLTNLGSRILSTTLKVYPHDVGSLVGKTNYTITNPETGSSLQVYGIYIDTETVDTTTTYGSLDAYATSLLVGYGTFYEKATCDAPLNSLLIKRVATSGPVIPSMCTVPVLGDTLAVTKFVGGTISYMEVCGVMINYDEGTISLTLGDYEKNLFASIKQKTSALNKTLS